MQETVHSKIRDALQALKEHRRITIPPPKVGDYRSVRLLCALAPGALNIEPYKTVICTSARIQERWLEDIMEFPHHYEQATRWVRAVSYAMLSKTDQPDLLSRLSPDLIAFDEASRVTYGSSRHKRIMEYLQEHPKTALIMISHRPEKSGLSPLFGHTEYSVSA